MTRFPQNLRVLVVDDSRSMRRIIRGFFQRHNVTLIAEAGNGQEALERIQFQGLDLIISDLNMPVMGGMALMDAIKQETKFSNIPFVIFTVEANQKTMALAMEKGAAAYIVKPITESLFIQEIHHALSQSGRI